MAARRGAAWVVERLATFAEGYLAGLEAALEAVKATQPTVQSNEKLSGSDWYDGWYVGSGDACEAIRKLILEAQEEDDDGG